MRLYFFCSKGILWMFMSCQSWPDVKSGFSSPITLGFQMVTPLTECVIHFLRIKSRTSPPLWRLKCERSTWGDAAQSLIMCGLVPWHPAVRGHGEYFRLRKSRAAPLPGVWGHWVSGSEVKRSMGINAESIEVLWNFCVQINKCSKNFPPVACCVWLLWCC